MICIVTNFPFYSDDIKISFLQQQKRFQDLDLDIDPIYLCENGVCAFWVEKQVF